MSHLKWFLANYSHGRFFSTLALGFSLIGVIHSTSARDISICLALWALAIGQRAQTRLMLRGLNTRPDRQ
jgi:hypothetical protein